MSFNIKNSFVSRSIVEDDKEKQLDPDAKEEEVVIQEAYDPRTLYERLQEQKNLKEEKFAEESRLSNQIKRVDEEEAEYFRTLSDEKEKLEYQRKVKEQLELEEYRQAVESARSNPVGQIPTLLNASTTITTTTTTTTTATTISKPKPINSKVLDKKSKNALKGALILKKKKRDSESEDEQEQPTDKKLKTDGDKKKPASTNNKATGSLGLLSAYGDISSSSDSEDDS